MPSLQCMHTFLIENLYLMSPDDDSARAVSESLSGTRNSRTPEVDSSLATAASARTKLVGATGLKAMWRMPDRG